MIRKGLEILKILSDYGESYIVGGAVRDKLLGIEPKDIDISTNVPMEKIESLFETHDIGKNKDFGVIVIKYKGFNFEIAQFREESDYQDYRHPNNVVLGVNFETDTKRRDFTINSIGMDCSGDIIDYHNGQEDISKKIIKAVGDPCERLTEDPLRMLRAIRFASRFDYRIDNHTFNSIKNCSHLIQHISPERINNELFSMASQIGQKFANSIKMLRETGLLYYILPEVHRYKGMPHNKETHPEGDVWNHVIECLNVNEKSDGIINISILLHDVGKPVTYKNRDGKHTYYGHDKKGLELINNICDRLKIDNNKRKIYLFCCENHMKFHRITEMKNSKIKKLIDDINFEYLKHVSYCDDKSRKHLFSIKVWNEKIKKIEDIKNRYIIDGDLNKLLNGKFVSKVSGINRPCKEIGVIIRKTREWILDNKIDLNDIEKIKRYIKECND